MWRLVAFRIIGGEKAWHPFLLQSGVISNQKSKLYIERGSYSLSSELKYHRLVIDRTVSIRTQRLLIWVLRQINYYCKNETNRAEEQEKCSTGLFVRQHIWKHWSKKQLDDISHRLLDIGKILGEEWDLKELENPRRYSVQNVSKTKISKFTNAFAQILEILVDGLFDKFGSKESSIDELLFEIPAPIRAHTMWRSRTNAIFGHCCASAYLKNVPEELQKVKDKEKAGRYDKELEHKGFVHFAVRDVSIKPLGRGAHQAGVSDLNCGELDTLINRIKLFFKVPIGGVIDIAFYDVIMATHTELVAARKLEGRVKEFFHPAKTVFGWAKTNANRIKKGRYGKYLPEEIQTALLKELDVLAALLDYLRGDESQYSLLDGEMSLRQIVDTAIHANVAEKERVRIKCWDPSADDLIFEETKAAKAIIVIFELIHNAIKYSDGIKGDKRFVDIFVKSGITMEICNWVEHGELDIERCELFNSKTHEELARYFQEDEEGYEHQGIVTCKKYSDTLEWGIEWVPGRQAAVSLRIQPKTN